MKVKKRMFITYYIIIIIINSWEEKKEKEYGNANKKWRWKIKNNTNRVWIRIQHLFYFNLNVKKKEKKISNAGHQLTSNHSKLIRNWFNINTNLHRQTPYTFKNTLRERNEACCFWQQQLLLIHTCIHLYTNTQKAFNSAVLPFRL